MFLFRCQLTSATTTTLLGGIEPPIYRLTAGRLNHWATEANTLTGNRTLATSVKAMYPNHWTMRVGRCKHTVCDYINSMLYRG